MGYIEKKTYELKDLKVAVSAPVVLVEAGGAAVSLAVVDWNEDESCGAHDAGRSAVEPID